jgi:hypothetical protein
MSDDSNYAIGYFENDDHFLGYGERIVHNKKVSGHWDGAYYLWGKPCKKEDIKKYNPNVDVIAQRHDYRLYEKKMYDEEMALLNETMRRANI